MVCLENLALVPWKGQKVRVFSHTKALWRDYTCDSWFPSATSAEATNRDGVIQERSVKEPLVQRSDLHDTHGRSIRFLRIWQQQEHCQLGSQGDRKRTKGKTPFSLPQFYRQRNRRIERLSCKHVLFFMETEGWLWGLLETGKVLLPSICSLP